MYLSKTAKHIVDTFGRGLLVTKNDTEEFNFGVVCMDNGRFRIGDTVDIYQFNKWLYQQIEINNLDLACVAYTRTDDRTLLWFDCDYMKDGTTYNDVLQSIRKIVISKYGSPKCKNNEYIILKNSSFNKYHFYVTKLFLTKKERKEIWNAVNDDLNGKAIIDIGASDLRFEGFNKYDRKQKKFIPNTNYQIIFPNDIDFKQFYGKVNLLKTTKYSGWLSMKTIKLTMSKSSTTTPSVNSNSNSYYSLSQLSVNNSNSNSHHSLSQLSVSNSNSNSTVTVSLDNDYIDQEPQSHHTEVNGSDMGGYDRSGNTWSERYQKVTTDELFASITDEDVVQSIAKCVNEAFRYGIEKVQHWPGKDEQKKTVFNCTEDEVCPFSRNRSHSVYLLWNHHEETLTLHCYAESCRNEKFNVELDWDFTFNPNDMEIVDEDEEKQISEEGSVSNKSAKAASVQPNQCASAVLQQIRETYPMFANILCNYPIQKIKKYRGKNGAVIFQCGKNEEARSCPFKENHKHSKSNYYFVYRPKRGRLEQKCHSSQCSDQYKLLWTRTSINDLPQANDSDLARYFAELYHDIIYSDTDPAHTGFYYKTPNFWVADVGNRFLQKRIQVQFAETVSTLYDNARNQHQEERLIEILDAEKKDANKILKFDYKSKHLINCLKTWLEIENIEWNANPYRVVFPNGVYNLQTHKFGGSAHEEYINNTRMMGVKYAPRNQAFIKKEIEEGIFLKIHPDDSIRKSWCQFASLAFEGKNFKKVAINHGPRGNNAKTKTCAFIIYVFGSYGHVGSNDILLKGSKDRASVANLHEKRVIAFEEPDDTKPLDAAQIKAIIGSDSINARMLYSTYDQISLQHIAFINLNSLPGLDADEAFVKRLIYYPWNSMFTSDTSLVDPEKHIYEAVEKYGDRSWWKSAGPQLVHYLLDFYKEFVRQGRVLFIPQKIQKATIQFCHANDAFMIWFNGNFELLDMTKDENRKQFVTVKELLDNFNGYSEKDKVFPRKVGAVTTAFLAKQIKQKAILANRWHKKITNWRISQTLRNKNKNLINIHTGQYAGPGLQYCKRRVVPEYSIWNYDNDPEDVNYNAPPTYNALIDLLKHEEDVNSMTDAQVERLSVFVERIKRKRELAEKENDDSCKSPAAKRCRRSKRFQNN